MGEPLSLATNMLGLITNAFTASKDIYSAVDAISNAPKHIKAIAGDLEDFYCILGCLRAYLENVEASVGVVKAAEQVGIAKVVENCLQVFTCFSLLIGSYNSRGRRAALGDMDNWKKMKYSFKVTEIEALRSQLAAHNMTLNMAISMIDLINRDSAKIGTQNIEAELKNRMQELEEKIPTILSHSLEDAAMRVMPRPQNHLHSDMDRLLEDYDFTLRRYLGHANSIKPGCCTPDTASIQVSSLGTAESLHISTASAYVSFYETAKTHISESVCLATVIEDIEDYAGECTQIFIKGPHHRTTVLQVEPRLRVGNMLLLHPDVPYPGDVFCTYGGQILNHDYELRHYKIPKNATLFCHIRTLGVDESEGPDDRIFVKTVTGRFFTLPLVLFEPNSTIERMVNLIEAEEGLVPVQQFLTFLGCYLDPSQTLAHYGIHGGSTVILVKTACIFVRSLGRTVINVPVSCFSEDSSISNLRRLVEERGGAPQNQQRLIFHGRQLDPAKSLEDYGISGGSTVQLVWRHQWRRAERYSSSIAGNTPPSDDASVARKSKWRSKLSAMPLLRSVGV